MRQRLKDVLYPINLVVGNHNHADMVERLGVLANGRVFRIRENRESGENFAKRNKTVIGRVPMISTIINNLKVSESIWGLEDYITYKAKPGDWLVLEKPELDLNPLQQKWIVKLLILLSKEKINLFITTHSKKIVEEFSKAIRIGSLSKRELTSEEKEYTDSRDLVLNPQSVRVYHLKRNNGLELLTDIKVDRFGIDENTHAFAEGD